MPNPQRLWRESHTCSNVCMYECVCVSLFWIVMHICNLKLYDVSFTCFAFFCHDVWTLFVNHFIFIFNYNISNLCVCKMGRGKKIYSHLYIIYSLEYTFPSRTKKKRFTQWPRNQWKCLWTIDKVERRKEHRHGKETDTNERKKGKEKKELAIVSTYVTVTEPCLHSSPEKKRIEVEMRKNINAIKSKIT